MKMRHKTNRQRSNASEKQLARQLGGRQQMASGSLPVKSLKGDVRTSDFLLDDKTTLAKSYGVKLADWRKLRKQAWAVHRRPAIAIHFEEEGVRLFVISEQEFLDLTRIYVTNKSIG